MERLASDVDGSYSSRCAYHHRISAVLLAKEVNEAFQRQRLARTAHSCKEYVLSRQTQIHNLLLLFMQRFRLHCQWRRKPCCSFSSSSSSSASTPSTKLQVFLLVAQIVPLGSPFCFGPAGEMVAPPAFALPPRHLAHEAPAVGTRLLSTKRKRNTRVPTVCIVH